MMGRILSLQGGMAVGKTTAARYLAKRGVPVFLEDISAPAAQCRLLGLDKRSRKGYIETQRLFIANEIAGWQAASRHPVAVLDLGPEEIEFYTLHYPATIGQDWPVAEDLAPELAALRRCRVDRTLFRHAGSPLPGRHGPQPGIFRPQHPVPAARQAGLVRRAGQRGFSFHRRSHG